MERSRAFTLRDLVVLLCLAALALPVLAATLQGTIDLSVAERCKANLASLTRCVLAYAAQNRGFMPVYTHRVNDGYVDPSPQPDRTAIAFSSGFGINPMTGLYADVRGLGLLYVQGLAKPPELFYCPAPIADRRHMLSNYPKPWGSGAGPGSSFIRIGYMFDPWVKQIPDSSNWTYEDGLVLRRHPADRPLLCDLVMSMTTTGHVEGNSASWNLAYPDGHVAPRASQELYNMFAAGFDARVDWVPWNAQVRPRILPPVGP